MTLVGKIKLESLIAGQPSPSRGNRSDYINDKQAFRRLWHLSPSDCDKHSSVWQTIRSSGTSVFVVHLTGQRQSVPLVRSRMLWLPKEDH